MENNLSLEDQILYLEYSLSGANREVRKAKSMLDVLKSSLEEIAELAIDDPPASVIAEDALEKLQNFYDSYID